MFILAVIYIVLLAITALVAYTIVQIKLCGMNVKDFWNFIKSVQNLETLYKFSEKCDQMNPYEQVIFLTEAEKIFKVFEKVPTQIWEEEYDKYSHVLQAYKNIKMLRWAEANS